MFVLIERLTCLAVLTTTISGAATPRRRQPEFLGSRIPNERLQLLLPERTQFDLHHCTWIGSASSKSAITREIISYRVSGTRRCGAVERDLYRAFEAYRSGWLSSRFRNTFCAHFGAHVVIVALTPEEIARHERAIAKIRRKLFARHTREELASRLDLRKSYQLVRKKLECRVWKLSADDLGAALYHHSGKERLQLNHTDWTPTDQHAQHRHLSEQVDVQVTESVTGGSLPSAFARSRRPARSDRHRRDNR
jgi:hypothetical protein